MVDLFNALQEIIRARERGSSAKLGEAAKQLAASLAEYARQQPDQLDNVISEALGEAAGRLDRVSIAVTGLAWLGAGVPSVEQEMLSLVRGAQREVSLCAYSVTPGAASLLQEIESVVAQGVIATIVVNALEEQPAAVQTYLRTSAHKMSDRWRVLDFARRAGQTDLHAKLLIVDRKAALVGSANLSFHGMVSNHEIAVIVRGPAAELIAARFDMLTRSALVRSCSG